MDGNEDSMQIAFRELRPYGPEDKSLILLDTKCLSGQLVSEKEILMTTPVVVLTIDGEVIKAWEGEASNLDTILNTVFTQEYD